MLDFTTTLQKFGRQGEKTGWTYLHITAAQAEKLQPGTRVSFRVRGFLDETEIAQMALLPMGEGSFILPLKAALRKRLRKERGATVRVQIEADPEPLSPDADFLVCLQDEPAAQRVFQSLARGHQNYFSKWIQEAKTTPTKTKRIGMAVNALAKGMGFPEMLRAQKKQKQDPGF